VPSELRDLSFIDWRRAQAILPRYAGPTPRYTSYPTAPVWREIDPEAFRRALAEVGRPGHETLSLYVHVPFCRNLCHFCACNRMITRDPERPAAWLETVLGEIERVREALGSDARVTQIHWGGGTPTHLLPEQIERLAGSLEDAFEVDVAAERSIEADPRVTTPEHLAVLREHGFGRLSLGIQDFDDTVQHAIHRIQPARQVERLVEQARGAGFEGVNFDLIYGLPFQTVVSFDRTLDHVLELAPDRVALYGYAHVTWVAKQQRGFERHDLPSPADRLAIFVSAMRRFLEAGYVYVGMDHFARPEDELARSLEAGTLHRNFMGYTTRGGAELLGFGPSAISDVGGLYAQSRRDLREWTEAVGSGGLATFRGHRLSLDDQERRFLIERVMCQGELSAAEVDRRFGAAEPFAERYAPELRRLSPLARDGLLELARDGSLCVTPLGRLLVRHVAAAFDAYLPDQQAEDRPRFSQGV
jgi:oxygen-independent coproporphyrinogen-3 oxidase